MILDDEEDILTLYSDYLSNMGHRILSIYVNADSILQDIGIEPPDIYIIDYRLPDKHERSRGCNRNFEAISFSTYNLHYRL